MGDWLLNLPIPWMAVVIFAGTYLIAACVYFVVMRLAVGDRARAFKTFSPGEAKRSVPAEMPRSSRRI